MAAFREPMRCIHDAEDLEKFKEGETLAEIMLFVKTCAEKSIGMKVSEVSVEPGACVGVDKFVAFVERLKGIVVETPPEQQPGRFGNKAFRTWHAAMVKEAGPFLEDLVPEEQKGAVVELMP